MTKIINLGTSAFYELQEATKKAIGDKFYNLSRKIKNELRK